VIGTGTLLHLPLRSKRSGPQPAPRRRAHEERGAENLPGRSAVLGGQVIWHRRTDHEQRASVRRERGLTAIDPDSGATRRLAR